MANKNRFQVQFQPTGKRIEVEAGLDLLEAALQAGIELASVCGGEGNCGQCQVIVLEGKVSEFSFDEEYIFTDIERMNGNRLACCTEVQGDLVVEIPRGSLVTAPRLQVSSDLREIDVDPIVRAYPVEMEKPTLEDLRADFERLCDALQAEHGLTDLYADSAALRALPGTMRAEEWRVSAFVRGQELVGVGAYESKPLGFAVDLGTTKVAAYLVDLESGEILASKGAPNPQIGYGEDVISRLNYAYRDPNGSNVLAGKVHELLNEMLGELLVEQHAAHQHVVEACIVGNTAMTHLLLKLPVEQLAKAPYVAAISGAMDVHATELGLEMAPGAYVYVPPTIGGYVGADHVAMLLATDLDQVDKVTLGVDIGTNTEISIRIPGKPFLSSASCASGPAFEGAHISDGMRAAAGAIEKVKITSEALELKTVDDSPAVGLCGSGIIDTISEMYRVGLINMRGRFQRENERVRMNEKEPEFVLVPADKSGTGRDVVIGQEDVNEIQLAKGAIHAGLSILMETNGVAPEEVEEVVIAGAFGSFLDVSSAVAMGLFPKLPNAHYRQVGNAAAIGAQWMLISRVARQRAEHMVDNINYKELTTIPHFTREFALGMLFPTDENTNFWR
ncbi:MAG: DUF4445 domain-containing protein [Anaerolineales bacterium]|nr:DUF4445 domain-containing protein [Anaerolineales bacterium]